MKKLLISKNNNKVFFVKSFDTKIVKTRAIDTNNVSIVGNIYVGKVEKVIKNSFAFINIGREKNAFININDKKEAKIAKIKQGDDILVQVLRDENDLKGASLTSEIVIRGKYIMCVYSEEKQIGVSKKIVDTNKKKRLRKIAKDFKYGVVFRTEAKDVNKEEIILEYNNLEHTLDQLLKSEIYEKSPKCVYSQDVNSNIIKNVYELSNDVEEIITNSQETYNELVENKLENVKYDDCIDIFETHFIKKQVDELFYKKIWLKSGAFLIVEYTEAFVVIDVNSGKNIKEKDKELLALKTNKEAIKKIVEQVDLRNLSGIILIDMIDMKDYSSKEELVRYSEGLVKKDTDYTIHGLTNLGILEITKRKRCEPIYKVL